MTLELKDQNEVDFLRSVLTYVERAPSWLPTFANQFIGTAELHAHVLLRRLLNNKEGENKCSPSS